jgi:hypothetical protein
MHERHRAEMTAVQDRHADEHAETGARHAQELGGMQRLTKTGPTLTWQRARAQTPHRPMSGILSIPFLVKATKARMKQRLKCLIGWCRALHPPGHPGEF